MDPGGCGLLIHDSRPWAVLAGSAWWRKIPASSPGVRVSFLMCFCWYPARGTSYSPKNSKNIGVRQPRKSFLNTIFMKNQCFSLIFIEFWWFSEILKEFWGFPSGFDILYWISAEKLFPARETNENTSGNSPGHPGMLQESCAIMRSPPEPPRARES